MRGWPRSRPFPPAKCKPATACSIAARARAGSEAATSRRGAPTRASRQQARLSNAAGWGERSGFLAQPVTVAGAEVQAVHALQVRDLLQRGRRERRLVDRKSVV